MTPPAWRVWLTTAQVCAWGILAIRFVQKENLPFAAMSLLLALANAFILWRLTRKR